MLRDMTQSACLKGLVAAVAVYCVIARGQARQKAPVTPDPMGEVIVYVAAHPMSGAVDFHVRATAGWIYARVGVRLVWRDGKAPGGETGGTVRVQVRYAEAAPADVGAEALAYARPFGEGTAAITVLYERVRHVAGRQSREAAILAHVLAHEIGHVLQGTNRHAGGGIMKAHWSGQDYGAMERKQLEFTPYDLELMRDGLKVLRARSGSSDGLT